MVDDKQELLLRLGDSALILSQRLTEWCGKGPALEEDMALANVSLDLIGQARLWLSYAVKWKSLRKRWTLSEPLICATRLRRLTRLSKNKK